MFLKTDYDVLVRNSSWLADDCVHRIVQYEVELTELFKKGLERGSSTDTYLNDMVKFWKGERQRHLGDVEFWRKCDKGD